MRVPPVKDHELLYRRVSATSDWYSKDGGEYRIEQAAFQAQDQEISVDRAALLSPKNEPRKTQLNRTDGVFRIQAGDVRNMLPIKTTTRGGTVKVHRVQVIHSASRGHKAHAIITVDPKFDETPEGKLGSGQLRRALARLVNEKPPVFILEPS